jgi:hypothetical protein
MPLECKDVNVFGLFLTGIPVFLYPCMFICV